MTYDFTPNIKTFLSASLLESLKANRPAPRLPSTAYAVSARVINNGVQYIAIQGGTTSAGPGPSASSGIVSDGTVQWIALGSDSVQDGDINSNLYLAIGKQTEWDNPSSPDAPGLSVTDEAQQLRDATAFIQVKPSNVRSGIAKNTWVSGTVYSAYNPDIEQDSYPSPFYVISDNVFVYKCIDNNNGAASTDAPTGTSSAVVEKADGYIWKYMGTIANQDLIDFSTANFVPVPASVGSAYVSGAISTFTDLISTATPFDETDVITTKVIGAGTGAAAATRVSVAGGQATLTSIFAANPGSGYDADTYAIAYLSTALGEGAEAEATLLAGAVDSIDVTAPGQDYVSAAVLIIGDGTGAEATATISGGQITTITVTDGGSGYTWAKVFVIPGVSGGVARAVLSPAGGHGSNNKKELLANTALISVKLGANLNSYVPSQGSTTDGSFRQVLLVGGVRGSTRNAEAYLGPSHEDFNTPGSRHKYTEGSGSVLYVNNIVAIEHTAAQEEVIKISISL